MTFMGKTIHRPNLVAWFPLAATPVILLVASSMTPWVYMIVLSFAIYASLKWLTMANAGGFYKPMRRQTYQYLLLWPGMDAMSFFGRVEVNAPSSWESIWAAGKVAVGLLMIAGATTLIEHSPLIAGWVGVGGMQLFFHFGIFHLLSVSWRRAGVSASPIMKAPLLARSLSDFWGKRWNLAFRDLSHTYLFRPFVGKLGTAGATMLVFLVSGLIHDIAISIPARGGYGLPTLYFVIQGFGVLLERSDFGKAFGARRGITGRVLCAVIVLCPVTMLFHRPFIERVIVPLISCLGTVWS